MGSLAQRVAAWNRQTTWLVVSVIEVHPNLEASGVPYLLTTRIGVGGRTFGT